MKILAIDVGTSRVKTGLFNESGEMLFCNSVSMGRGASPTTQDAREWYAAVCKLLHGIPETPDVLSLTGNMHALLGVDKNGDPVADAVLWTDNSAQAQSDDLNARFGEEIVKRFGNSMIPVFTLPKIMRLKEVCGETYKQVYKFLQSKDFIACKLTDNFLSEPTDSSGVSGMDLDTSKWDFDFLSECGLDGGKMPEIVPSASVCGCVSSKASSETGLPSGIPVVTGAGDLSTAALGSALDGDTMSLTLGTAGQLLACGRKGNRASLAGKLFAFAHADPTMDLYLGSVPAGGFNFDWLSRMMNIPIQRFFELAAQAELRETLPVYLPYVLGRGAPFMDYRHCGEWRNLSGTHTQADLCLSAVFHTLCPLRQCADLLDDCTGVHHWIVLQSLAERQGIVRKCASSLFSHKRLYVPTSDEASLLGAAVIAAVAMGVYPDFATAQGKMVKMVKMNEFETKSNDLSERLYRRFLHGIMKG